MNNTVPKNEAGFTIIELLIVMLLMGLVMTAIHSLYVTHQRSTYVQDEVVEVQQNLRIGIDSMTRDIRMAGFLIPQTTTPVAAVGSAGGPVQPLPAPDNINSDTITVNTAAGSGTYARINADRTGLGAFTVDSAESVDAFSDDEEVRIIRPGDRQQPGGPGNTFKVTLRDRAAVPPTITLAVKTGADINASYVKGDIIAKTDAAIPNTIVYCLGPVASCGSGATCPTGQLCLMRVQNGTTNVIASNLAGLQLRYLMDNLTELDAPVAADFGKIRSIRVTLIGQTQTTTGLSGQQSKRRQMESIIQIRNR
jgi:prepilin-type N-terminal cleavage/methylation domain-containing protein